MWIKGEYGENVWFFPKCGHFHNRGGLGGGGKNVVP